jgi:hypothetical protein
MASIKKKMSSLIPEVEGRSKEVPSYEDEQSEIIDEIVTKSKQPVSKPEK